MINIFAEDTNLPGPVAAFSWCVEKRDIERLKELGAQKLFMLIIVAHQDSNGYFHQVNRRLVPFSQAVEYIEFYQPGVHRIFGWVVWSVDGLRALRREMSSRRFSVDLMGDANAEDWGFPSTLYYEETSVGEKNDGSSRAGVKRDIPVGSADVVVPEGHFAKEPPPWLRWWVNLPYGAEPADQCHFRKRLLQAIFIQPFWVAAFILVKSLLNFAHVLVLWLCGVRKINYETFRHPFFYALGDAYVRERNSSWFIADSSGGDRPFFVFLAMPMVQIAVLAVISLAAYIFESFGWGIVWWLLGINTGALVVAAIINMFAADLESILDKLFGEDPELVKSRFEKEYARYGDVVCTGAPVRPGYENVPAGRRTLRLRFQYIKSKVCLPFARRRL